MEPPATGGVDPAMRPLRRPAATLAAAAIAMIAVTVPLVAHPEPPAPAAALAALGWMGIALLGLWRGRVWGLFALVASSALLWASAPPASWALAAATLALAFAVHLPALVRADRSALLLGIAIFAGTGGATGLALEGFHPRRAWRLAPEVAGGPGSGAPQSQRLPRIAARPSPDRTAPRDVGVSIEQVPGQRALRVTLRNPGPDPLTLDVPKQLEPSPPGGESPRPWHSPLLDPLIRVEAFDGAGTRLEHVRSFGCGMVYSSTKVVATVLPPGGTSVHVIDLPAAWYPGSAVLPEYSHGMLMNPDEVSNAPHPVPAGRVFVRVVYDSAALSGSWRDDLSSGRMAPGVPVRGTSAGLVISYGR